MTDQISEHVPLDAATAAMIVGALGPVQSMLLGLGKIDTSFGQARVGPYARCVWLSDGCRVTIEPVPGGGHIAYVGYVPDPEAVRLEDVG